MNFYSLQSLSPSLIIGFLLAGVFVEAFKKWKISCFRHEDISSDNLIPESADDLLHEPEQVEIIKPIVGRSNWRTNLRMVSNALFRAIGKPWTVPWTAETILQQVIPHVQRPGSVQSSNRRDRRSRRNINPPPLPIPIPASASRLVQVQVQAERPVDILIGCFLFPFVNRLSQFNLGILPILPSTPVALSSVEQSIMARDPGFSFAFFDQVLAFVVLDLEDGAVDFSRGCDGCDLRAVEEPFTVYAAVQPVEWFRVLGFDEMKQKREMCNMRFIPWMLEHRGDKNQEKVYIGYEIHM
ncbi:CAAX amino terminal protease family protein [Striga asiatica]|uniref:CAAX amino terminal protease family protein n=1 Tax=Striga asiatica TaxID=4170 RepID=A0A5A7RK71_STRAF|nr:CAAX amino terminal protease family protein [Striga asiatica]